MMNNCLTAGVLAVAACLADGAAAQARMIAETSSPGDPAHASIVHLAEVAAEAGVADIQVRAGQTLTNSLLQVVHGEADIAAAPLILVHLLHIGRGPYGPLGEGGAAMAADLRALWPYNAGAFGLIAPDSAGIDAWADLAGRAVWNGPPRGAALAYARQAIAGAAGLQDGADYTGVQTEWGALPAMLEQGTMAAFVLPITFPSDHVFTLAGAGPVVIVSTPKAVFESPAYRKVLGAPGTIPIEVAWEDMGYAPGSGVRLIAEDGVFRGLGSGFADVVHKDMPFDTAKRLTEVYIATMDRLKASTPYAGTIGVGRLAADLSGFCGANPLTYHPGAIAAWEAAGIAVPDCARPGA